MKREKMKTYRLFKIMILMVGLSSMLSAVILRWAPLIMGDITTFVPYVGGNGGVLYPIKTVQDIYNVDETVSITVNTVLSGDEDWVGIYPKGSSTSWSNVIAWNWVKKNGTVVLSNKEKSMPAGNYEARLFFHNKYTTQASDSFVVRKAPLSTVNATYNTNETVSVNVQMALSGDQDWVGIFHKGDTNSWGNVIAWNWVKKNGTVVLSSDKKSMPAGEYEVRLFYHNEYGVGAVAKAVYAFTVNGINPVLDYEDYGTYGVEVEKLNEHYLHVYRPIKNGQIKLNAPVVIVSTGGWSAYIDDGKANDPNSNRKGYVKFIEFIVSKGYLVIAVSTTANREVDYQKIKTTLDNQGDFVDKSKIGVIGSSTGGGSVFYNIKRLKEENYAENSFVIPLDGWFALGLTSAEVENLDTTTLILQFGGSDGISMSNNRYFQDPRIFMSIYNLLPGEEKAISFIENDGLPEDGTNDGGWATHAYVQGEMDGREDMLRVVGAMLSYKFENGGQAAKAVALDNRYDDIAANVPQTTEISDSYIWKCKRTIDMSATQKQNFDYCNVNEPVGPQVPR